MGINDFQKERNSSAYGFTVTECSPLKFAFSKELHSLADFTLSYELCSKC